MSKVTFEEWEVPGNKFEHYTVNHNGSVVAKLLVDTRKEYNSILSFHEHKHFNADVLADVSQGIRHTFGALEFVIGSF